MISAPLRLAGGIAGFTLHELAPRGAGHLKMQVGFRHRDLLVYSSVQKASGQSVAIIAIVIRGVKTPSTAASSSPSEFSSDLEKPRQGPESAAAAVITPSKARPARLCRLDDGRRRLKAECAAHLSPTLAYAS